MATAKVIRCGIAILQDFLDGPLDQRVPRLHDFVSHCRLVKCAKQAAGKSDGTSGTKIGHANLKWAFSEAAGEGLRPTGVGGVWPGEGVRLTRGGVVDIR